VLIFHVEIFQEISDHTQLLSVATDYHATLCVENSMFAAETLSEGEHII